MVEPSWIKIVDRNHAPLFLHFMASGQAKKYHQDYYNWDFEITRFRKRGSAFLLDQNQIGALFPIIESRIKNDPEFPDWFVNRCYERCNALINKAKSISSLKLENDSELKASWDELSESVLSSMPILASFFAFENLVQGILLQNISSRGLSEERAAATMSELIIPLEDNYIVEQIHDIWEICAEINEEGLRDIFISSDVPEPEYIAKVAPKVYKRIKDHAEKYGWLKSLYTFGEPYEPRDIIMLLVPYIESDPTKLLTNRSRKRNVELNHWQELVQDLKLNESELKLLNALRQGLHLHTYKMDAVFLSYYLARPLVAQVAHSLGLEPSQLVLLTHDEIASRLAGGNSPSFENVAWRESGYDYDFEDGNYQFSPSRENYGSETLTEQVASVRGNPASPGHAVGMVRVVMSTEDAEGVRPGEVLVTSMTTPDMMIGIERCCAIVTNEGGLLCHAAIVSREIGIPCVIGTSNATEILHNHEVVEVLAGDGIIERIKWRSEVRRPSHLLWKWLSLRGHAKDYFEKGAGIQGGFSAIKSVDHTTYLSEKDQRTLMATLKREMSAKPNFPLDVANICRRESGSLVSTAKQLGSRSNELSELSPDQLITLFNNYLEEFLKTVPFRGLIYIIGKMLDQVLSDWMKEKLEESGQWTTEDAIGLLSLPVEENLYQYELSDLLEIGSQITKIHGTGSLLPQSPASILQTLSEGSPELVERLNNHIKEFGWIATARDSRDAWSVEDLISRLAEIGWDACGHRLLEIKNRTEVRKAERKELLTMLGTDDSHYLARIAAEYAFLKQHRIDVFFIAEYTVRPLYGEIASRLELSLDDMFCLSPDEICSGLAGKNIPSDQEILKRKDDYALLLCIDRIEVFSGDETDWLRDEKVDYSKIDEIFGVTANQGDVTGKATLLITRKNIDNVAAGDIVVSPMTTPEMMPALEKCVGIVTDEGGLLSHAAIVSRELDIPCIVGTDIATKVFTTGDIVEMHATPENAKVIRVK